MTERLSLLFVDDDPLFLDFIVLTAREVFPGVDIALTPDSLRVEGLCASRSFDCVILDYRMPGKDGLECAKALRAALPYLPIVLLTGAGDEMIATSALQSGVTDYIPKARLNAQSLRRTIKRAVQLTAQRRVIDEQRTELETFAYALAHDFRQPLRQMTVFTQLVADELGDQASASTARHLAFVEAAALRLTNLVDVMSEYTLLGRPVEIEDVDLQDVIDNVCTSIAPFIEERGGRVVTDCREIVRGNTTLMTQALQNLIVNGLKYNRSEIPTVTVTATRAQKQCRIAVCDNGIGIDPEYHEKIFSPLIRLHAQSEYTGTGLGLTMVRKAITGQGGTVNCRSTPGNGAEFSLTLRLASRHASRATRQT